MKSHNVVIHFTILQYCSIEVGIIIVQTGSISIWSLSTRPYAMKLSNEMLLSDILLAFF